MTDKYDAIIVGGGHNGLVCAGLLAKSGKRVLVLEANDQVGGAAVTREFADGYSVSACAHLLYQLQPAVRKDLKLSVKLASDDMTTIALGDDGEHVRMVGNKASGVSDADARSYRGFRKRMTRFADLLGTYFNRPPPRLGTKDFKDVSVLARLGLDIRRLGRGEMQEFLRLIGMNIHDEVVERFESPLLKGAISLDAVLGTHLGPRSPNTIMTYLYRQAGNHGRIAAPKGGMSSVTEELAHVARTAGATIRTGMAVTRIVVENGRVAGVETEAGERFDSMIVISNADPKRTIMRAAMRRSCTWRSMGCRRSRVCRKKISPNDSLSRRMNTMLSAHSIPPNTAQVRRSRSLRLRSRASVTRHWRRPASMSCRQSCSTRPMR
jgi:phytoene dehydrogenase-like protein